MRFTEIDLAEGGKSSAVRYNSEVALLHAFAGNGHFDINDIPGSFDSNKLDNPEAVLAEIDKFLTPSFNADIFDRWAAIGVKQRGEVAKKLGTLPARYSWTGGANAGPAADVEFVGHPCAGISVKDTGGITLKNLTPKAIGIEAEKGLDVFRFHAEDFYIQMKQQIFQDVLTLAKAQADRPLGPLSDRYTIVYNSAKDTYLCKGKKHFEGSADKILDSVANNAPWQRVFGDWFQANWSEKKAYAKELYLSVAKTFEVLIEQALSKQEALERVLAIEEQSYFYATPKGLYYVPSKAEIGELKIQGLKYAEPDGTSQKYFARVGRPDSDKSATIEIYIRYANGMFETNPTVRIQSLKDPQYLGWEKLI